MLAAPSHDLAVADDDELVGDDLDLAQQVGGEQGRAIAVPWPSRRGGLHT